MDTFQEELAEGFEDLDSNFDVHIDDCSVGSGTSDDDEKDFDSHIKALQKMFATARGADLKQVQAKQAHLCSV